MKTATVAAHQKIVDALGPMMSVFKLVEAGTHRFVFQVHGPVVKLCIVDGENRIDVDDPRYRAIHQKCKEHPVAVVGGSFNPILMPFNPGDVLSGLVAFAVPVDVDLMGKSAAG